MANILDRLINQTLNGVSDSDPHLMTLFGLALNLKAQNILELGVRYGDTTTPLLIAANFTGGLLFSVDINKPPYNPPEEIANSWVFVHSDAIEYLESLGNDVTFDLILVDDWHAYRHVKRELELIEKIVTPSSVVVLHDLMYGNRQPNYYGDPNTPEAEWAEGGPYRAVSELDKDKWEWATIPASHGLTILRKLA